MRIRVDVTRVARCEALSLRYFDRRNKPKAENFVAPAGTHGYLSSQTWR